jgi:hypothetical protein
VAALALAGPAWANDAVTVNHSNGYVDLSIASAFVTVPNLCDEPIGSQGTSAIACSPLGEAAIRAIQHIGPDVYWEAPGNFLTSTNAFVPSNAGPIFGPSGFFPIFSMHKYDLFGRGEDIMGPLNRIELLYLQELGVVSGAGVDPQTQPGSTSLQSYFIPLLTLPAIQTTYNPGGGIVFNIADLTRYVQAMGFAHGGRSVINSWCTAYFSAIPGFCTSITLQLKAELYINLSGNLDFAIPVACGSTAEPTTPLLANCNARDQWIDQTVATYVESWPVLGGDLHFAQNFRSQVGFDPTFSVLNSGTQIWVDQRLQQSVELSGAFTTQPTDPTNTVGGANQDFIQGRQTFEQAIATNSAPGFGGLLGAHTIGQLVSQDVNGFFFSCLNCDVPGSYEHDFTPAKLDVYYQPYTAGWYVVPTIVHAAQN